MSKKNKSDEPAYVYSTDPAFRLQEEDAAEETLPPGKQQLRIRLETKHRAGKAVTIVDGFTGRESDLAELGKKLKTFCGTGGSAKNGEIIIQGDLREKVKQWLVKQGYKVK
jgi:translation initiation factor 1